MSVLPNGHAIAGIDRAAVMVMLLDEEAATKLLAGLSPEELRKLGSRMCSLGEIDAAAITGAISSFAQSASQTGISTHGRVDSVRRIMTGAVGETRADSIMRRVAPDQARAATTPALDIAKWLEPEVIIPLIEDEYPQTIAVLLVQLEPDVAAAVLAGLPEDLQTPVVHRIARLGPVSPGALAILEETLASRISDSHGQAPLQMGGVREAADILNNAARTVEKRVMPAIGKLDKKLAKEMEREMFKFEHLFALEPRMMGTLLREIESEVLIDALKGVEENERDYFFDAMSGRAADGLRDEIEARGRLRKADADNAQQEIIAVARRLAEDGSIVLGSNGDDDYV